MKAIPPIIYTFRCENPDCTQYRKDITSTEGPIAHAISTGKFANYCDHCKQPLSFVDARTTTQSESLKTPTPAEIRSALEEAEANIDEFLRNLRDDGTARTKGQEPA